MQTLIPFTAHWFMTRAMLITCKACNCACRKHESTWIVYNYSITLSSEGEMILWQADVTGIKDQSSTLIELWAGLEAQLKEEVQDGSTDWLTLNAMKSRALHHYYHLSSIHDTHTHFGSRISVGMRTHQSQCATLRSEIWGLSSFQLLFLQIAVQTSSDTHLTLFVSEHQNPTALASMNYN